MSAQDAGTQDQAEQGLAEQEYDEHLRAILYNLHAIYEVPLNDVLMLASALKIDARDVT